VTNYVLYATYTDGGNTWLAGGNRVGNGVVDVAALTASETYYVVGYSSNVDGKSVPSNVVKLTLTATVGGKPTILVRRKVQMKQRKIISDTPQEIVTETTYGLGVGGTLAAAGLEAGDKLPDNSSAEIIGSSIHKVQGTVEEEAVVRARQVRAYTGSGAAATGLVEVFASRVQGSAREHRFVRIFECPVTELVEGEMGWTHTSLPTYGTAYPYGTWTGHIVPGVASIDPDPHFLKATARITVTYLAPRSRAGA